MANRVAVMTARPGRIKSDVRIDLPHPRHYTDQDYARVLRLQGASDRGHPGGTIKTVAMGV